MGSLPLGLSNQISVLISHFVNVRQLMVIPRWWLRPCYLWTIFCCKTLGSWIWMPQRVRTHCPA